MSLHQPLTIGHYEIQVRKKLAQTLKKTEMTKKEKKIDYTLEKEKKDNIMCSII